MKDVLYLKWGTLKDWSEVNSPEAKLLINEYLKYPVCISAMYQKDTKEQKEILYKIINCINGKIINDLTMEEYTKKQAKDYVKNYNVSK